MSLRVVPANPLSRKVRAAASRIRCRVRSDFAPPSVPFPGAGSGAGRAPSSGGFGAGGVGEGVVVGCSSLMAPVTGEGRRALEKF